MFDIEYGVDFGGGEYIESSVGSWRDEGQDCSIWTECEGCDGGEEVPTTGFLEISQCEIIRWWDVRVVVVARCLWGFKFSDYYESS